MFQLLAKLITEPLVLIKNLSKSHRQITVVFAAGGREMLFLLCFMMNYERTHVKKNNNPGTNEQKSAHTFLISVITLPPQPPPKKQTKKTTTKYH